MAPATIEEYKYEIPEGMEPIAQMDDLRTMSQKIGISTKQFGEAAPIVEGVIHSQVEAALAALAPSAEDCVTGLSEGWKGDTEKNMKLANGAFKKYGGEELTTWLEETGIGNQPLLIKAFHAVAEATMDDTLETGSPIPAQKAKASVHGAEFDARYGATA